ncbi:PD40 domain-containing protein [Bacillus sinesaloumensis]|uniref:PD40 domain-containing protein n=1 Tax=Litchfieldia sinesaloumensis TaxID=1926280 RepID=UPI0009887AA7|nr:PD40 domain-containing protein [Bacillus sinesaloumensis]
MNFNVRPNGVIAYTTSRGGDYDIWIFDVQNGTRMQLTYGLADSLSKPVWSDDDSKIAFVGKNRIVYVIYLSTGRIAAIDQINPGGYQTLDWSPNHRTLAYTARNQIMMYDVVSHRATSISASDAAQVQWFPNGRELLFRGLDASGNQQLFRIATNGFERKQVSNVTDSPLNEVSLSPDGTFALYTTPGASISLVRTVDLSSGNLYEIRGGEQAKNYYPAWSPNSQYIAFSATAYAEGSGYYNEIRLVGKRGGNERVITTSSCFATPVTWSPDNRKIAYLSGCTEQGIANEMWMVDVQNNRTPVLLMKDAQIGNMSWSKRGSRPKRAIFISDSYKVQFFYPADWQQIDSERYEGVDGFFQISAIAGGNNIHEVCKGEAFHQLMPYGSSPRIYYTRIRDHEACLIYPSADQPPEMSRQAAAIVRYPVPVQIEGSTYNYFILWADEVHLASIVGTIAFK